MQKPLVPLDLPLPLPLRIQVSGPGEMPSGPPQPAAIRLDRRKIQVCLCVLLVELQDPQKSLTGLIVSVLQVQIECLIECAISRGRESRPVPPICNPDYGKGRIQPDGTGQRHGQFLGQWPAVEIKIKQQMIGIVGQLVVDGDLVCGQACIGDFGEMFGAPRLSPD